MMTGSDFRTWREARGLTQQQAGELVGFKPKGAGNSWSRIECDRERASETLCRLIQCLGVRGDLPQTED